MIKCESSPPRLTILLHFDSSGGTHTHTHTLSQVCQVHPNSHVNGLENNIISCTNIHFHAPVKCKHGSALFNDNPNIPSGQFAAAGTSNYTTTNFPQVIQNNNGRRSYYYSSLKWPAPLALLIHGFIILVIIPVLTTVPRGL